MQSKSSKRRQRKKNSKKKKQQQQQEEEEEEEQQQQRRQHTVRQRPAPPKLRLDGVDELASETVVDDESGRGNVRPLQLGATEEDAEA